MVQAVVNPLSKTFSSDTMEHILFRRNVSFTTNVWDDGTVFQKGQIQSIIEGHLPVSDAVPVLCREQMCAHKLRLQEARRSACFYVFLKTFNCLEYGYLSLIRKRY